MAQNLTISIDLGSDKIKTAFAYEYRGEVKYGKLANEGIAGSVISPAIAYFDEDKESWLFGENVYRGVERPFITVVKIKTLLSLLLRHKDKKVQSSNKNFYLNKTDFPKFYFPSNKKVSKNMAQALELDMTFKGNMTPQSVCQNFFDYIAKECVLPAVKRLEADRHIVFDNIDYVVVYPPKAGSEYVAELTRLVTNSFGKEPKLVLSSTKALGLYAYHRGIIRGDEQLVIADMGEEDISVAKISISADGKTLLVDGVDGHNEPINIGGNDIDYAIKEYIESQVCDRETLGMSKIDGYVAEQGMHSKQFLMMTEIKKAKVALSLPDAEYDNIFAGGVPINLHREVIIQQKLTREDFCRSIGFDDNTNIARQISDYILSELKRSVNKNVSKLILSGGLAETYYLVRFIRKQIRQNMLDIQVITFDDFQNKHEGFVIQSNEDSVFAPAVGGAIVALKGYEIKTAVALSYATWQYRKRAGAYYKILDILIKKGAILPKNGGTYSTESSLKYLDRWESSVKDEEIFSTTAIDTCVIGEPDSDQRRKVAKQIDLKVVSGGKSKGIIGIYLKEGQVLTPVSIKGVLYFREGVKIDADGRAVPFVENDVDKNGAYNTIMIKPNCAMNSLPRYAYYKDIVLKFSGVEEFDIEGTD